MWSRYVAIGDSFTEGLMDEVGVDGRHRGWADRFACHLRDLSPDLVYANLAIRGRLLPQVVEEQVPAAVALQPDLVSLAAGVNDALRRSYDATATLASLESGVRQLRASGADVMLFCFGDPSRRSRVMGSVRERILAANAGTQAIAAEHGCIVVDFWGHAAFDSDDIWDEDRLHLSPAGHALAARAALEAVGCGDDSWRTPAPLPPTGGPVAAAAGHARWAARHFGPWLVRRLQGRSSGDGIEPKRAVLAPPECGFGVEDID